jgi:hypothetical protein
MVDRDKINRCMEAIAQICERENVEAEEAVIIYGRLFGILAEILLDHYAPDEDSIQRPQ